MKRHHQIALRIPYVLYRQVLRAAKREQLSFNAYVVRRLQRKASR